MKELQNEYYFNIAGLDILLRVPRALDMPSKMNEFVTVGNAEKTDCVITVEGCGALPYEADGGMHQGFEYYCYSEDGARIFHSKKSDVKDCFAVTCFEKKRDIRLYVLSEYLDYFSSFSGIFNRISFESLLLNLNGIILHSSFVKCGGSGIMFSGPSGVGKSTQAELWLKSGKGEIINGDRTVLRKIGGEWTCYGSPYAGTSGVYKNDSAKASAVVVLKQGQKNTLKRLRPSEAFMYLYPEITVHRWDKKFVSEITELLSDLLENIPVYFMECLPDSGAVDILAGELGV